MHSILIHSDLDFGVEVEQISILFEEQDAMFSLSQDIILFCEDRIFPIAT